MPPSFPGRSAICSKAQMLLQIVADYDADEQLLSHSCFMTELSPNMLFDCIYYFSPFPKLISGLAETHVINVKAG